MSDLQSRGASGTGRTGGLIGAAAALLVLLAVALWLGAVPGGGTRWIVAVWLLAWPLLLLGVGIGYAAHPLFVRRAHTRRDIATHDAEGAE